MKKILIYVNDGFAVRYLLRSRILEILKKNYQVNILSPNAKEKYFIDKFKDDNVYLHKFDNKKYQEYIEKYKIYRLLIKIRSFVLNGNFNTQTIDDFKTIFLHEQKWMFKYSLFKGILGLIFNIIIILLKKIKFLRLLLIQIESYFFTPQISKNILSQIKPDLVIVTSLCGFKYNELFAREVKQCKLKLCTIILSWDNTTGMGYPGYFPDYTIAWTEVMANELIKLNDISKDKIFVGGVAHFDYYFNNKFKFDKLKKFKKLNINSKIIFYATKSPRRFPWGPKVAKKIAEAINSNQIDNKAHLLIRVHPLHFRESKKIDIKKIIEEYLDLERDYDCVSVNIPKLQSEIINFDMIDDEIQLTGEILSNSSVMLNMFSTMIIEASIFNLPSINIALQNEFRGNFLESKQDIMIDHRQNHLKRIINSNGTKIAYSYPELIDSINIYLDNPSIDKENRQKIVDNEVGLFRGNAPENIVKIIKKII